MESSLRDNLQRLSQEKALIASGQELVAQLMQGITQRMGRSFAAFVLFILWCIYNQSEVAFAVRLPAIKYPAVYLPIVNILT